MLIETPDIKPATTPRKPSKGLVLVVDDEEQNRSLLRDYLEVHDYAVTEAACGMSALEEIDRHPPDVVLLDLMMPKMDGFEVCRRLKTNLDTAHIPVLMVTALSEREERLTGIRVGANDFLSKPVDVQDLTLRVGNAVYAKRLRDHLHAEKEKSEQLLLSILPRRIAERMKKGETNIADSFPEVTVLVADLVGFTTLSTHIGPEQVVIFLNEIFSAFDLLIEKHGLEKIKTIGDAFMAAGNLSIPCPGHADAGVKLALDMQGEIIRLNQQYATSFLLRIGICTGPVVAGVIGRNRFAYDLWGETVNLACRLETVGEAGKILISESTHARLKHKQPFKPHPSLDVKGHGRLAAYWLDQKK